MEIVISDNPSEAEYLFFQSLLIAELQDVIVGYEI